MDDIDFIDEWKRGYESSIFLFKNKEVLENLYIKFNKEYTSDQANLMLEEAMSKNGLKEYLDITIIKTADQIIWDQINKMVSEFKIIFGIVLLLFIYVGSTLFGVFYKLIMARVDEFAIRRSFGCTQAGLFVRVISESMITVIPGLLIGAVIFINFGMLTNQPNILEATMFPVLLILLMVLTTVFVPAIYISKQRPVEILRGN
jgi:ABC-type antimicrobial peptide transport system permease subunit